MNCVVILYKADRSRYLILLELNYVCIMSISQLCLASENRIAGLFFYLTPIKRKYQKSFNNSRLTSIWTDVCSGCSTASFSALQMNWEPRSPRPSRIRTSFRPVPVPSDSSKELALPGNYMKQLVSICSYGTFLNYYIIAYLIH
jgi:hypothetical protein